VQVAAAKVLLAKSLPDTQSVTISKPRSHHLSIEGSDSAMNPSHTSRTDPCLYRVLLIAEWKELQACGQYIGNAPDKRDGFIHLSTRQQVPGTIVAHFAGVTNDITIIEIDSRRLPHGLRWEPSRDGMLFPHFYGVLPLSVVTRTLSLDQLTCAAKRSG